MSVTRAVQEVPEALIARETAWQGFYRKRYKLIWGMVSMLVFVLVWEAVYRSGSLNPLFTSSPTLVFKAMVAYVKSGEVWTDYWISMVELLSGFLLAILIGIPVGILAGWYKLADALLNPFVLTLYPTPIIAFLPLLIIWFGIGFTSKIIIIFLGAFFPIMFSTATAFRTVDPQLLKAAKSFGATDAIIFKTIALPGSVPSILTGVRLGIGRALMSMVISEFFAAQAGIGHLISVTGSTFQTNKLFVGIVLVALTGLVLSQIATSIEQKFDAWRVR